MGRLVRHPAHVASDVHHGCRAISRSEFVQSYRFFSIDGAGVIISDRFVVCADDADAREIADDFITSEFGIEVWDVARQVFKASPFGA